MSIGSARDDFAHNQALKSVRPTLAFLIIIFSALIAFEIFNFSTTDHALGDLLGDLSFWGMRWSTILALAFCGIDFAGIARLFTPEQGADEPKEVWYLFGAWLLAATMNAILTWWGVSMAVASHTIQSSSVIDPAMISQAVPIFVAVMVWVIRILIIGTLSMSMDRVIHPGADHRPAIQQAFEHSNTHAADHFHSTAMPAKSFIPAGLNATSASGRPAVTRSAAPKPSARPAVADPSIQASDHVPGLANHSAVREPAYHSIGGRGQSRS